MANSYRVSFQPRGSRRQVLGPLLSYRSVGGILHGWNPISNSLAADAVQ